MTKEHKKQSCVKGVNTIRDSPIISYKIDKRRLGMNVYEATFHPNHNFREKNTP